MYVCSYAVKADKAPLFDEAALRKLKRLGDGLSDDKRLLGAIARSSEGVRAVGGEEAVGNLLGNDLTLMSTKVHDVSTMFLISQEGSLTDEQRREREISASLQPHTNIPPDLDPDELSAAPKRQSMCTTASPSQYIDPIIKYCMRRPAILEDLIVTAFYEDFDIRKLRKNQRHVDNGMYL